jgi:hypothetical protein
VSHFDELEISRIRNESFALLLLLPPITNTNTIAIATTIATSVANIVTIAIETIVVTAVVSHALRGLCVDSVFATPAEQPPNDKQVIGPKHPT